MAPTRADLIGSGTPTILVLGDGHCAIYAAFFTWLIGSIEPRITMLAREQDGWFYRLSESAELIAAIRAIFNLDNSEYLDGYTIAEILSLLHDICPSRRTFIDDGYCGYYVGDQPDGLTIKMVALGDDGEGNHWDIIATRQRPEYYAIQNNVDLSDRGIDADRFKEVVHSYLAHKHNLIIADLVGIGLDERAITERIQALVDDSADFGAMVSLLY